MSFTLLDVQRLLEQCEERITAKLGSKLDLLTKKVDAIETSLSEVKAVQAQQEADITRIKEILVEQQHQVEAFEERARMDKLIFSNVPEGQVSFEGSNLSSDLDKVKALVTSITSEEDMSFDITDVEEVVRIGRGGGKSPRILKVCLADVQARNTILRSSRHLNSNVIRSSFGRIYVNKDMSHLRRLEEKRLRDVFKVLKTQYPNEARLKNGILFLGSAIKDRVNYSNQLF